MDENQLGSMHMSANSMIVQIYSCTPYGFVSIKVRSTTNSSVTLQKCVCKIVQFAIQISFVHYQFCMTCARECSCVLKRGTPGCTEQNRIILVLHNMLLETRPLVVYSTLFWNKTYSSHCLAIVSHSFE